VWVHRGKNENDEIALRNVVLRDRLMILHDRVRPRRIHHRDFPEHFLGQRDPLPRFAQALHAALHAINQFLDAHRARPRRHFANVFPQQRIDETALPRLHFAHDHQQRRCLEIRQARPKNLRRFNISASFRQPQSALEQTTQRLEPLLQLRTENSRRHLPFFRTRFWLQLVELPHAPPIISRRFFSAHKFLVPKFNLGTRTEPPPSRHSSHVTRHFFPRC
jgi:hypothetical protein